MRTLLLLLFFVPSYAFADNVFSDVEDDDDLKTEDQSDSFLSSIAGGTSSGKKSNQKWQKFRSLEEYGVQAETPQVTYDEGAETRASHDYMKSKDPFSNSDRFQAVESVLNPPLEQ